MKIQSKLAFGATLMVLAADAMAQPHRPNWLLATGAGLAGGFIGFLLGLWWCRHCHEKNKGGRNDRPNDR